MIAVEVLGVGQAPHGHAVTDGRALQPHPIGGAHRNPETVAAGEGKRGVVRRRGRAYVSEVLQVRAARRRADGPLVQRDPAQRVDQARPVRLYRGRGVLRVEIGAGSVIDRPRRRRVVDRDVERAGRAPHAVVVLLLHVQSVDPVRERDGRRQRLGGGHRPVPGILSVKLVAEVAVADAAARPCPCRRGVGRRRCSSDHGGGRRARLHDRVGDDREVVVRNRDRVRCGVVLQQEQQAHQGVGVVVLLVDLPPVDARGQLRAGASHRHVPGHGSVGLLAGPVVGGIPVDVHVVAAEGRLIASNNREVLGAEGKVELCLVADAPTRLGQLGVEEVHAGLEVVPGLQGEVDAGCVQASVSAGRLADRDGPARAVDVEDGQVLGLQEEPVAYPVREVVPVPLPHVERVERIDVREDELAERGEPGNRDRSLAVRVVDAGVDDRFRDLGPDIGGGAAAEELQILLAPDAGDGVIREGDIGGECVVVRDPQLPVDLRVVGQEPVRDDGALVDLDGRGQCTGAGATGPVDARRDVGVGGEIRQAGAPVARAADGGGGQHPAAAPGHVRERAVVGVGGQVVRRRTFVLVKAVAGCQSCIGTLPRCQDPVHGIANLLRRARLAPHADLVDLAGGGQAIVPRCGPEHERAGVVADGVGPRRDVGHLDPAYVADHAPTRLPGERQVRPRVGRHRAFREREVPSCAIPHFDIEVSATYGEHVAARAGLNLAYHLLVRAGVGQVHPHLDGQLCRCVQSTCVRDMDVIVGTVELEGVAGTGRGGVETRGHRTVAVERDRRVGGRGIRDHELVRRRPVLELVALVRRRTDGHVGAGRNVLGPRRIGAAVADMVHRQRVGRLDQAECRPVRAVLKVPDAVCRSLQVLDREHAGAGCAGQEVKGVARVGLEGIERHGHGAGQGRRPGDGEHVEGAGRVARDLDRQIAARRLRVVPVDGQRAGRGAGGGGSGVGDVAVDRARARERAALDVDRLG